MHMFDKPTQQFSLMHNLPRKRILSVAGRNYEFKRAPKLAIIDQR